jgi:hypothetical protein
VSKVKIDGDGNVGIGTSAPVNNSNRTTLGLQGVWGGQLDIMVGSTVHAQFGTDNFSTGQSARIQSQDGIVFKAGGSTERMRIHSEGYTELKSSDAYNQLVLTPSGTNAPGSINFNTPGTGRAKIKVQNNEYISILSNGNVGIGETNPSARLDVVSNSASGYVAEFRESNASNFGTILIDSPTDGESRPSYMDYATGGTVKWSTGLAYLDTARSFHIGTGSGTSNSKVTINTSGNVGIGTTDPSYAKLHIINSTGGGNDNFMLMLQNTTTVADSRSGIMFSTNSGQGPGRDGAAIQASNNGIDGKAHITFGNVINNVYEEKVRFTTDGNVGIGTTSPGYRLDVQGGKVRHRGATQTGSGNLVFPNNTNFQTYAQENGFQIAAENSGDWASHLILTNVPASGTNKHWVIHHAPTTNNTSYKQDSLVFTFQNTSSTDQIGGDGAGNTALALQSNGSAKVNGSAVGENFGVNGRAKFHGADYQQIKLQSSSNQGFAGIQFSDIISPSDGNNGLNDTSQLGFLRFSHGDGMNQTISGQTANAGYVFGSSENVNVISFQHNMTTTSYGTNAGEIRFGSGVSTTYSTSSDRRIKENITTLASGSSKTKILAMNPVTYNLINDPNETPVEHTGFIAQEMHEIMPEIVQGHGSTDRETGEDTIMSIDYSKLTPVLVGALQDALAEIETLKARLDAAGIE